MKKCVVVKIKIDELKLYFGEENEIFVTDKIKIQLPKVEDIIEVGEQSYLNFCQVFTMHHLEDSAIVFLDSIGVDFANITDWVLFISIVNTFDYKASSLLFGDLDFQSFQPLNDENGNLYIKNKDGTVITETIYKLLVMYIRKINNIPKPKYSKMINNKRQKRMAVRHAKIQLEKARIKSNQNPSGSFFMPMVTNLRQFHSKNEISNMNIFEFWASVKRFITNKETDHLYYGLYSGCLNLKDNPSLQKQLNYLRN